MAFILIVDESGVDVFRAAVGAEASLTWGVGRCGGIAGKRETRVRVISLASYAIAK